MNARPFEPPCAACGLLDSARNPHAAHGGSEVFSSNCYLRDFSDDVLVAVIGDWQAVSPVERLFTPRSGYLEADVRETRIPSFCMRNCRVDLFIPSLAAAPSGPETTPFD
jgi:hypothetical protein